MPSLDAAAAGLKAGKAAVREAASKPVGSDAVPLPQRPPPHPPSPSSACPPLVLMFLPREASAPVSLGARLLVPTRPSSSPRPHPSHLVAVEPFLSVDGKPHEGRTVHVPHSHSTQHLASECCPCQHLSSERTKKVKEETLGHLFFR